MSSPDEKAATFDPDAPPIPPVGVVGDLTSAHIGLTVEIAGVAGELAALTGHAEQVVVGILESDRPFVSTFDVPADTPCSVLADDDVVQVTDVVGLDEFFELARELDRVSRQITANDASTKALKERKRQLSEKMLGTFAQVGETALGFTSGNGDARRAYTHREIVPEFEEREDGKPYTYRDLVPVLKGLGREEQVTPETVNYRTLQGFLREVRDGVIPMPPELAKMVKIGEKIEVRVGVGRKSKR